MKPVSVDFLASACGAQLLGNKTREVSGVKIDSREAGEGDLFVCVVGVQGVFRLSRESQILFGAYPSSAVYGLQNFLYNHFRSANYAALSAGSAIFLIAVSALLLAVLFLGRRRDRA